MGSEKEEVVEQKLEKLQQRIEDLTDMLKSSAITEYQKRYLTLELQYTCMEYSKLRKDIWIIEEIIGLCVW